MAYSATNRLGLKRPLAGQAFERQNWAFDFLTTLDLYPGVYPCTAATRPATWGANQTGMFIFEIDTGLLWRWTGAAFVRHAPVGLLGNPVTISADFSTAATTPTVAISAGSLAVPATNAASTTKRIKIEASWYAIENGTNTTLGAAEVSITRDGTVIMARRVTGRPATDTDYLDWAQGGSIVAWDNPTTANHTYALCINSIAAVGGTTVLKASATQPAQIAVSEVGL
jgi:hypothetical protein